MWKVFPFIRRPCSIICSQCFLNIYDLCTFWILNTWNILCVRKLKLSQVENLPVVQETQETHRSDPWVGRSPGGGKWQSTPVFLLEKSHGQRSLIGHSPWGHKELDATEWLTHARARQKYSVENLVENKRLTLKISISNPKLWVFL